MSSPSSPSSSTILDPSSTIASLQETLSLDVRLVKALQLRLRLQRPTLVQAHVWPLTLQQGKSCLIRAPTGSGKTLAYLVPAVQKILVANDDNGNDHDHTPRTLVLVPTRELCHQVHKVVQKLLHYCNTITAAILSVGIARGTHQQAQQARQWASLRDKPHIVVGTPAAVAHAIRQNDNNLAPLWASMRTVILDEADLLVRLGHETDLRLVVQTLPRLYQGLIVSATLDPSIESLQHWALLETPVKVQIEEDVTRQRAPTLKQYYLPVKQADKYLALYVFLKLGLLQGKGLFFVATVNEGYRFKLFLQLFHIRAAVLNSELPLASRLHILEQFHLGNMDYLIATDDSDMTSSTSTEEDEDKNDDKGDDKPKKKGDEEYGVARGVDFYKVSFVVNVDFPLSPTIYRHRIGRTARGGRQGVALSLVTVDPPKTASPSKKNRKKQASTPTPSDWELLQTVQEDQPRIPMVQAAAQTSKIMQAVAAPRMEEDEGAAGNNNAPADQAQPVLLDFDLQEIEGFRYRVEDVSRAVTRKAVQEARTAELKAEILNSERLQNHFAANPADAKLLQHDRPSAALQAPQHLKHVPKYLLPKGMQVANLNKKRKKKKRKLTDRASKDPLQSFQADVNLDGVVGEEELDGSDEEDETVAMNDEAPSAKRAKTSDGRVFISTREGTGKSTSGRNSWKERHNKGKYSNKKHGKQRRSEPLGI